MLPPLLLCCCPHSAAAIAAALSPCCRSATAVVVLPPPLPLCRRRCRRPAAFRHHRLQRCHVTYLSTLGTYLGTYIYSTFTVTERLLGISQIKTLSRLETLSRHYQDLNKSSFMIKIEHDCSLLEYLGLGLSS
jgi:hypothetical protein